jgi:hypothetical protein
MSPLVERHGSRIEVESEGEENGTFTMVLPTKETIAWRTWTGCCHTFLSPHHVSRITTGSVVKIRGFFA